MPTLYRQYRPQRFADIFGQQHITDTLKRAVEKERIAHAYLFHGPRGTGKTTTARILAKRLNCEKPQGPEACGSCTVCVATASNKNIDIIEIDAASNRGIDDIRALQEGITTSPALGHYKVYIIDEVHMLTNEAFTALLKTLEEPVKHAIFILATTEFHKVPETIISRCQVFRFRRATEEELRERLTYLLNQEKRQVDDEALAFIIGRSDGCYRDAESLLSQVLTLHDKKVALSDITELLGLPPQKLIDSFLGALIRGESGPAVAAVDELFAGGFDPEQFLHESIRTARDGAMDLIAHNDSSLAFVKEPAALTRLPQIIRALVQAVQDISFVPQPLIALHLAILSLCSAKGPAESPQMNQPAAQPVRTSVQQAGTQSAKRPISKAQAVTTTRSAPAPQPNRQPAAQQTRSQGGVVPLEKVKRIWPQVIKDVKASNPVASTFLRAMEPTAVDASVVRVQAFYALHRNFFDKAENREAIEQSLQEHLKHKLTVRVFFNEEDSPASVRGVNRVQQEQDLIAAVKEVFG